MRILDEGATSIYKCRQLISHMGSGEFLNWLDKLLIMGTIGHDDWDRECGKFFGYPKCCIKWFIFMSKLNAHVGRMTDYLYGAVHCGYVKCPKCIKETKNARL